MSRLPASSGAWRRALRGAWRGALMSKRIATAVTKPYARGAPRCIVPFSLSPGTMCSSRAGACCESSPPPPPRGVLTVALALPLARTHPANVTDGHPRVQETRLQPDLFFLFRSSLKPYISVKLKGPVYPGRTCGERSWSCQRGERDSHTG